MILQALVTHYENLAKEEKVSKLGWCQAKVSYAVNLSPDGHITGIITLKEEKESGKKKVWLPKQLRVPEMVTRSSGVNPNFLCDNAKYLLGIDVDEQNKGCWTVFRLQKKGIWIFCRAWKGKWPRRFAFTLKIGSPKKRWNAKRFKKSGKILPTEAIWFSAWEKPMRRMIPSSQRPGNRCVMCPVAKRKASAL